MRTHMGVVYPEHCDAMGHMNVQHYIAAFDRAFWHFVAALGYSSVWRTERSEGWADVRHEIDFRNEVRLGELFVIDSEVSAVGRSSLTALHRLSIVGRGPPAAELLAKSAYFDLSARKARPLPDDIRQHATAMLTQSEFSGDKA